MPDISDSVIRLSEEVLLEADKLHRKRLTTLVVVAGHCCALQKGSVRVLMGVHYHQMRLEGHSQEALAWGVLTLHHSDLLEEVLVEQSLEAQELHLAVQMMEEP